MKRDMELVRKILLEIERQEDGYASNITIDGYSQDQIWYHAFIMKESGLIEGLERKDLSSLIPKIMLARLTWSGHEFLDNARNDTVWKKAMDAVKEKGGGVSIGVLTQLLSSLAKSHFGLP